MAVLEHEVRSAPGLAFTGLTRHVFSRHDYVRMGTAGLFDGQRVELIEGEIIQMAPIGDGHSAVTQPLGALLQAAFGSGFDVRNQAPISMGSDKRPSEPQPDLAVVVGSWRDYFSRKPVPRDVVLIVEVADSSLSADRNVKAVLYASARIPESWIVNLVDFSLEVHREPGKTGYKSISIYRSGAQVKPLLAPNPVATADFLP